MLYSHKTFRCGLVNKMISQHESHQKYCVCWWSIEVIIEEPHCWHVVCGVPQSRWRCYRSSPTLHGEQYLNINQICVDAPLTHDQQTSDFCRLYNEVCMLEVSPYWKQWTDLNVNYYFTKFRTHLSFFCGFKVPNYQTKSVQNKEKVVSLIITLSHYPMVQLIFISLA